MRTFIQLAASGRTLRAALIGLGAIAIASSCSENLPSGPNTFSATLAITVPHDTIVIGDTSSAQATAMDSQGRQIQNLSFTWTSTDSTIVGFVGSDTSKGRAHQLVAKKTGRVSVSIGLPDPRFAAIAGATRSEVGVVGGVKILSTKDSTLTSVNDTAVAIAAGLVRANGALVPRSSTGLRWIHHGQHTTVAGQGDTIRYISQSNGPDTLIATNDFCLVGAKCADTVVARVAQVVSMSLNTRSFAAWSFADSVGPAVTLADKRGNGLPGSSIRLVPATTADSVFVKVSAPQGTTNLATGAMATPKLVASGNGTAKVYVNAIGADGTSIIATDSVTVVVRQVARRVAVEPLRALMTSNDSIPIRPIARDARGFMIPDATISVTPSGINVNGIWAVVPIPGAITGTSFAIAAPALTGVALPSSNPTAPQVDVAIDTAQITLIKADTLIASNTATRLSSVVVLDSTALPAPGKVVNFSATAGVVASAATTDINGTVFVTWLPPDTVGTITPNPLGLYSLVGVRNNGLPLNTAADSAGLVVIRRSVLVQADVASATKSTIAIGPTPVPLSGTATITVTLMDRFGNITKTGAPGDFTVSVTSAAAALGAKIDLPFICTNGVCTATYHAPTAGPDTLTAVIVSGGANMVNSPLAVPFP